MPYKPGDSIVFKSLADGSTDTISISHVERFVPDGEQIYFNELIVAYSEDRRPLILLSAGYGKNSEAYLEIRGFEGDKQFLEDIDSQPAIPLATPYGTFNDVVIFEGRKGNYNIPKPIKIWWSRSTGIIQFEQSDDEVLQLLAIERTESE